MKLFQEKKFDFKDYEEYLVTSNSDRLAKIR